ncbi:MAG: hypothetical protein PSV24_12920 [Rhodoferax sp.]|nr:hypothetical protein [Rhodoferax sp.]
MRFTRFKQPAFILSACLVGLAHAQGTAPIERIKITDNDLSCQQLVDERNSMDKLVADAKTAQSSGQTTATAGQAAVVAAEVAQRTGMFGALGGLTGHLFGSVAAKTAANVAEQSGQQDAAQAAAREKQALARKEHLTQMFLAKGCSASDPSAPGRTPNSGTGAAVQAPSAALSAPVAKPASTGAASVETLSGKRVTPLKIAVESINPEDLLGSNRTLIVATAYVTLVTDGRVAASKQSGLFQSGNASAHAAANFQLRGLDKAYAQQLAAAAQDNLVTQLRAAGYTVLAYADVKDRDVFRSAARESGQVNGSEGSLNTLTVAPTDEQHFKTGFAGGIFSEFISGGKTRISDATVLIPHYSFHAPQAWAEGSRGYNSVSASTNVVHGMNMASARVSWLGQPVSRMMRGIPGVATTQPVINVSEKVGELSAGTDASPTAANALSGVLSNFGGGNIQRTTTNYTLAIDRDAYAAGVINGAVNFNAEVARVAAAAKP